MTVLKTDTNGGYVRSDPLRDGVHFFEAAATVGEGTSDLVYEDCPS